MCTLLCIANLRIPSARHGWALRWGEAHPMAGRTGTKAERKKLAALRDLETLLFALGFATGVRWRGRRPSQVGIAAGTVNAEMGVGQK
jgi:hypothetical protein